MRRQGVRGRFEFVVSSADYGVRKPDPILFEVALPRLGCRPVAYNPRAAVPQEAGAHAVITEWSEFSLLIAAAEV